MTLRRGLAWLALSISLSACAEQAPAPTTEGEAICRALVGALTDHYRRCDLDYEGLEEETEAWLFGEEGCAPVEPGDFRDPRELIEECVPALGELACEATILPEPCLDQL